MSTWDEMKPWDRRRVLDAIRPGAAEQSPATNLLMYGHPDTVKDQVERVAELIAEELREVADWQPQDVEQRADEWAALAQVGPVVEAAKRKAKEGVK